jgi:hypothetical protein
MTLKKYQIAVTDPQYWEEVHDLLCDETDCEHIPNRKVSCCDEKCHSKTRGTFELHGTEADSLKNHPHIAWVELDPTEYPDKYPQPELYAQRFPEDIKIYRDLTGGGAPPVSPTSAELNRTGWQTVRTAIKSNSDFWSNVANVGESVTSVLGNVNYSVTGKHVDVVIHDAGVLAYHPEFLDENGRSRVRDIVLDGPFYIDPDYFITNTLTEIRADGSTGITEASAREWWNNSASRSAAFSAIGTIAIDAGYTRTRAIGDDNLNGANSFTSGHGTACASLVGGKTFGPAFECNIWNMSGIGNPGGMGTTPEQNFDCIKLFHIHKPINPLTGVKNPTLVNGSWGYQAAFFSSSTVSYRFRGATGTFTGNAAVTNQVTAMKEGLNNQVGGAYKSWSSSARSNATSDAASEMMNAGVLYVAAAGNNNQRLGIGAADPDRLNYLSDNGFGVGDPRPEFGGILTPCNHRDWMIPQGCGFDSATDFHPVVCVGAMDEFIESDLSERKADYSNNGPGIDVWAPADETLAAGSNGVFSYTDFVRYDNGNFYDCWFNGTSAAAPVACGVIALYVGLNLRAMSSTNLNGSRLLKQWLLKHGSVVVSAGEYRDDNSDDTQTAYWTGQFNLRDAERRIIYNPYAKDNNTTVTGGVSMSGVYISGS